MNKTYNQRPGSRKRDWTQIAALAFLLVLMALVFEAHAQEGSKGNTTIFGSAQMTFFGNHDFVTGGAGTQPGVILTERAPATISYLNFSGNGLTSTGASDAGYVDGYVRKYGTGLFLFPTGDNGHAGQFAASADGTNGAYFFADPSVAVTSDLFTGADYVALPTGAPFSRALKAAGVGALSPVEYWDINGATATPITLTWGTSSAINTLTAGVLSRLSIAGWDGTQWVKIPSTYDVTSVFGTPSSTGGGSITTTSSIVPDTYTAYTFASSAPDLTPIIVLPNNNFLSNGVTKNFTAGLYELLSVATGENVQFSVTVPTGYTLGFNPSQTTITPTGSAIPVTVKNSEWTVIGTAAAGRRLIFQANAGITIAAMGNAILGFTITRVSAQPGSTPVVTVNITNDATNSVYDSNNSNNIFTRILSAL